MASVVGICNRALQKLGAKRITSITEDSVNARACNNCYESLRDDELTKHPWSFAITRVELAADAVAPAFGKQNSYTLPADHLRTIPPYPEMDENERDWIEEGGKIYTNYDAPLQLRYVAIVTDPNLMHVYFREALASRMSKEMAEELTQSNSKIATAESDYREAIAQAKKTDGIQKPPQVSVEDSWVTARQ